MACNRQHQRQRGTGSVEWIGLAAVVGVLAALLAPALSDRGSGPLSEAVVARLGEAIGDGKGARHERVVQLRERVAGARRGRTSTLGADDLRMRMLTPQHAWRSGERRWSGGSSTGLSGTGSARGCIGCVGAQGRWSMAQGAFRGGGSTGAGVAIDGRVHAYAALAQFDVHQGVRLGSRGQHGSLQGRLAGTAGLDGELEGAATLTRARQRLRGNFTAVAGARVRAEQQASIRFAGISLQQTAGAEAWAGAGLTGRLHLEHRRGKVTFGARAGGALGLGGASDLTTTIDVSRMRGRHERTPRVWLAGARGAAGLLGVHSTAIALRHARALPWTRRTPAYRRRLR